MENIGWTVCVTLWCLCMCGWAYFGFRRKDWKTAIIFSISALVFIGISFLFL